MHVRSIPAPLIFCILSYSCGQNHLLKEVKELDYPSASGIEYFDRKLYLIGDDANRMLILDSSFQKADSVNFFHYAENRIPKAVKTDLEGMAVIPAGSESLLMMVGSGSLPPWRSSAYLLHAKSKKVDSLRLDSFYTTLGSLGIKELNIEGVCATPNGLVLSNRGHLGYRYNHLIFTSLSVLYGRSAGPITIVKLGGNDDTSTFRGVSGLAYARKSDRLIMTVSTEATASTTGDGAIGKSYLWIIKNFTGKRNWKAINPDDVIDLEAVDKRFRGHKVESVCITHESNDFLHLVLAADNDDGTSNLFRVVIEK